MNRSPIVLLLALLLPTMLPGQATVITGRVLSASTGRALTGASVYQAPGAPPLLVSDSGCYLIKYTPRTKADTLLVLLASSAGYENGTQSVRLTPDTLVVDFRLRLVSASGAVVIPPRPVSVNPCRANAAGQLLDRSFVAGLTENRVSPPLVGAGRGGGAGGGRGGRGGDASLQGSRSATSVMYVDGALVSGRGGLDPRCRIPAECPGFNTESYDRIIDNPFLATTANPLSTLSIDVDRASYSNLRRFIGMGQKPPKDAVRIEEMLNYFPYQYPEPSGNSTAPFAVATEVTPAPWNPVNRIVRIALQGRRIDAAELPPANLVFLIDVSGSMGTATKLPLVKTAMGMLLDQLREQDQVAIVTYAGTTGIALPSTSASQKSKIRAAIDHLIAGGGTAGGAGLRMAYSVVKEHFVKEGNNRIILATDGDFNLGISSDAEMERLVEDERNGGSFLTVLGFGMGNLKDSKLEKLADKGNGNYAYINSEEEAEKTLVREMTGTLYTIAKDVKLQVEFNPAKVQGYRLIGYENRLLRPEDFANDRKDAGEMGAGHSVTALYEVVPAGVKPTFPLQGADTLRYQTPSQPTAAAFGNELMQVKVRYKMPSEDVSRLLTEAVIEKGVTQTVDFRFATAVAEFGMILRDSEYRGRASLEDVLLLARSSLGRDATGDRGEFVRLVMAYQKLGIRPEPLPGGRGGGR